MDVLSTCDKLHKSEQERLDAEYRDVVKLAFKDEFWQVLKTRFYGNFYPEKVEKHHNGMYSLTIKVDIPIDSININGLRKLIEYRHETIAKLDQGWEDDDLHIFGMVFNSYFLRDLAYKPNLVYMCLAPFIPLAGLAYLICEGIDAWSRHKITRNDTTNQTCTVYFKRRPK